MKITPTVWQIVKRNNRSGYEHVRTITKQVAGSAPSASFKFDVPVRFDTDSLPVQAKAWDLQIVNNSNLVEVSE